MSRVDKMMIMGVRAFATDRGDTIQFDSPLTIVAGINGSGKTTIIECLRFATTGSLPPGAGTKGSWIHDPGLRGEKNVLAQVKLQFHAADDTRVVATRSLELSLKKNTRTQKTRECALLIEKNGEKSTLSTRVSDLDTEIPLYMGVSTSLLDNVIFCHQEDSQWPLAESSTLKKKFDEIFEAGRYTKAVKELIDIRKRHRNDVGRQQALADAAKKDRDRAKKVSAQLDNMSKESEELRRRAAELETTMEKAQKQADEAWQRSEGFAEEIARLEQYRIEANRLEHTLHELKTHLREVSESDEWLSKTLEDFDNNLSRYEATREAKKTEWLQHDEEVKKLKKREDTKLREEGQHQRDKLEHERQIEQRKLKVREGAIKHQVRGFDDVSDDSKVEDFLFKIKKISKDRSNKLEQARAEADNQKRNANTLINQLTARQNSLKDNRLTANQQIAENTRQASQRQAEVDAIKADEGSKAVIETRIEELQKRLDDTRATSQKMDYPSKLKQANLELSSLESDANNLHQDLVQSTKRAGEVAQLSHVKQELKEKESSLKTLLSVYQDRISSLVGSEWHPDTLDTRYKAVHADATRNSALAERERDGAVREAEQILYKQKTTREELEHRKRQSQQYEKVVKDAIGGETPEVSQYEKELETATTQLEIARENTKDYGGLASYFSKVLLIAESRHACRLCERSFKGPDDAKLATFKSKVQTLIEKASGTEAEEDLQAATEYHKRIADASVSYENWKRLVNEEIPMLETEVEKLNKKHVKVLEEIEAYDKTVEERQSARADLEGVSGNVTSVVKTDQDIKGLSIKLEELTAKQSQHGEIRTLEDIQENINVTNGRIQEAKRTIDRLSNERDTARSETYAMELTLRESMSELQILSRQLDRKTTLLDRVQEFKALNQKQREVISKIDEELGNISPELDAANAKRDDVDQRTNAQLRDLTAENRALDETVSALEMIDASIRRYIDEGGETRLSNTVRELDRINKEKGQLESAKTQLTKEITNVEKQLNDSDHIRRQYADNLKYRQDTRRLKVVRGEIETLESKNVEYDRDESKQEAQQKTKEYHHYSAQRERVMAELTVKDVRVDELHSEYVTDLKDAGKRYKQAHIKVESTKAAVEDIGKYSTALDQAVTKYHSNQMEKVNTIIQELWQTTYMGTDVDNIYIKSDLEVKANTRSHNYRVVMLKRDVELDMRGRCSAGQKVLASIIIRLALAECFSRDCGVIALDEPTTNLDERNVEALAESLHRIIESRRKQKNFQLIVITHDERFLELMNCADFTDHYFHVSRDKNDNSIIEKQSILDVMRK